MDGDALDRLSLLVLGLRSADLLRKGELLTGFEYQNAIRMSGSVGINRELSICRL